MVTGDEAAGGAAGRGHGGGPAWQGVRCPPGWRAALPAIGVALGGRGEGREDSKGVNSKRSTWGHEPWLIGASCHPLLL